MDEHTGDRAPPPACGVCGHNQRAGRLTLGGVVRDAWRQVIELDLPTVRTIGHMAYKPHSVARAYVRGDRTRYLNPIKFCFVAGAIMVLAIGLQRGGLFNSIKGPTSGTATASDLQAQFKQASAVMLRYAHIMTIAALPVLAGAVYWLFRSSGYNAAEQLAMVLLVSGEVFLFKTIMVPLGGYANGLTLALLIVATSVWMAWAIMRFERASPAAGMLRALLAIAIYLVANIGLHIVFIAVYVVVERW